MNETQTFDQGTPAPANCVPQGSSKAPGWAPRLSRSPACCWARPWRPTSKASGLLPRCPAPEKTRLRSGIFFDSFTQLNKPALKIILGGFTKKKTCFERISLYLDHVFESQKRMWSFFGRFYMQKRCFHSGSDWFFSRPWLQMAGAAPTHADLAAGLTVDVLSGRKKKWWAPERSEGTQLLSLWLFSEIGVLPTFFWCLKPQMLFWMIFQADIFTERTSKDVWDGPSPLCALVFCPPLPMIMGTMPGVNFNKKLPNSTKLVSFCLTLAVSEKKICQAAAETFLAVLPGSGKFCCYARNRKRHHL